MSEPEERAVSSKRASYLRHIEKNRLRNKLQMRRVRKAQRESKEREKSQSGDDGTQNDRTPPINSSPCSPPSSNLSQPEANSFPALKLGLRVDLLSQLVLEWKGEWGPLADWCVYIKEQHPDDEEMTIKMREGDLLIGKVQAVQDEVWSVGPLFTPEDLADILSHISTLLETCVQGVAIITTLWKLSHLEKQKKEAKEAKEREKAVAKSKKSKALTTGGLGGRGTQRVFQRYPSLDGDSDDNTSSESEY